MKIMRNKGSDIIKNWNITRKGINKFFKLKNGQWLKIVFSYKSKINMWFMTICVAKSKRQCNDCMTKTEHSPKVLYGHHTGIKTGLEPFVLSLKSLMEFEKTVKDTKIRIVGVSTELFNIYKRLKKYGYLIETVTMKDGSKKEMLYKLV